jgi:hypothetical protein
MSREDTESQLKRERPTKGLVDPKPSLRAVKKFITVYTFLSGGVLRKRNTENHFKSMV